MEKKNNIIFEITGKDLKNVKRFQKQHDDCPAGTAGDQFTYSFLPTGLGLFAYVKCSCGQTLTIGNFMDHESEEYDESKYPVLTEEDRNNKKFERAVESILAMKHPKLFHIAFRQDQSFEMIYAISAYGVVFADERISSCILPRYERHKYGNETDNYEGLDEAGKIARFYEYFEAHVKEEVKKYDCQNEQLLKRLSE